MKEKVQAVAKWILSNPYAVSAIFATAIGVINIVVENSHRGTKFYVTLSTDRDDEEVIW